MSDSPLAYRGPFAKPSPYDFGPSTWGPSRTPYDFGPNPYDDPTNTFDPTASADGIRRRGYLRGF